MAQRLDEEIAALDATMTSVKAISYDKVNVQTTPENKLEQDIVRKDELMRKLEDLRDEYIERYMTIHKQIDELQSMGLYKDILLLRYVDGKPFWKIAEELNYDLKYITNCHGKALKEFGEQYLS